MSAEMIMPLTFATFFICGVKGLTNLTQRTCVNLLLKGVFSEKAKDGGDGVLNDSDCTNYIKGQRKLSADIQIELDKLSLEDFIERLKRIKIRNLTTAAEALRVLVRNSSLSEKDKEELLKDYHDKLTLLVHRSERKAREQSLDTDHDNTRVYEKTRKT